MSLEGAGRKVLQGPRPVPASLSSPAHPVLAGKVEPRRGLLVKAGRAGAALQPGQASGET